MRVVTFGEVMIRLAPPGWLRLSQVLPGRLDATFGGAEVNVAVSIAVQGGQSAFCTVLPDNPLTDAFLRELRRYGVDTDLVRRTREGRFGMYFVETGANQRGSTVTYDRAGSAVALAPPESYDWPAILRDASCLHVTGITPALSPRAAQAALMGVEAAARAAIPVSCDLNFRKKLWNWEPGTPPAALARRVMEQLLQHVSLVIANEEDAEEVLGIRAPNTDVSRGKLDPAGYVEVARQVAARFPRVQHVAITLRESLSASHNNWGALLYAREGEQVWFAPTDAEGRYHPYEIRNIVDRVGAGDAFGGALLFALDQPELSAPPTALAYAVAASSLKHSIVGDFNCSTRAEIEGLMRGGGSGRVQR
jgi:2-dehydro-3-deoxygluconokinase